MRNVLEAAVELQDLCREAGWSFCIIGGLAVMRWGNPRLTVDVDVTLLTGFGDEERFLDGLSQKFKPRLANWREFARANRIVLLESSNGVRLDIALAGFPFEERAVGRASAYSFTPEISLITASAEDLVITKAFADRPRDWNDIESVIACQSKSLNWKVILSELAPLCELKEAPEIVDRLVQLREELK